MWNNKKKSFVMLPFSSLHNIVNTRFLYNQNV